MNKYIYFSLIKKQVLDFIIDFIRKNDFAPTYAEIANNVKSNSSNQTISRTRANHIVEDLIRLGLIKKSTKQSHRKREVVETNVNMKSIQINKGYLPNEFSN